MRTLLAIAVGAWLASSVRAEDEKPTELPPLLKPPPATAPPTAGPRGPNGEYDPGYFYLPEREPQRPRPAPCGPDGRIWIGPGLELAWMKPADAPVLLRSGGAAGPVAYGGSRIATPTQAGLGLNAGIWMNEARTLGFDAGFLYVNGTGSETVIGPTNAVELNLPPNLTLADPATGTAGAFQAGISTLFASADVNQRTNLFCGANARLDSLVGYRFARLADDFEVYGKRLGSTGEIVRFRDESHVTNDFHGGQVGLAGEVREGKWFLSGSGKIAFGVVFSDTTVQGRFRTGGTVEPVGHFATAERSGMRNESQFAALPAGGFSLGRRIGEHGRVAGGYQFLYQSRVFRGPAALTGESATTGFWIQSLSLTAEWRY